MDTPNRKENIAKLLGFLKQKGYASKGLSLEGLDTRLQNDSLRRDLYNALSRDKVPDIGSWNEFSSMVKKEKDSTAQAQPNTKASSTPLVPNSPLLPSPNKANKNTLSTDWTRPTPQFSIPTSEQNPGVPTLVPSREHPYVGRELAFVSPSEVTNLNTGKKHYDASKTSVIYPDEIGEDNTRKAIDNYTQAKASEANRLDRKIEAQLQDIEKQQKELEARLNKRAKELEAEREGEGWFVNFIRSQPARGMDPISTINRLTNDGKDQDEEYIGISSALHNLRKQKEKLLATKKSMQEDASFGPFLKNVGRGFVDTVTDTRIWDGGEGDLREAGLAIKAIGKLELQKKFNSGQATKEDAELLRTLYKGQLKLTPAEDALLNSKAGLAYVDAITKEAIGYGYGAGETTANMLPFIRDIALSPANGLGRSVATNVAKSALKSGLSRAATKAISRTARVVGDIALEGAGTALTTGIGGTLKGAADEQIGDIKYDVDGKTGQIVYAGREHNEENFLKAFGKSLVRQALEYGTEATGGAYIGTLMKPINKYGGKLLTKTLGDKAVSAVEKFFARMEKTSVGKAVNSVGEQVHYDGLPGEYLEEVYNNLLNAVTIGDMKLDTNSNNGVFNPEINKTIIIGLMGAPMATVSLKVGSIVAQDTKTQAMGLRAFGYKQWQEMKTLIGNSDDVSKTISEWAEQNPNATSNQKKAVMRYAVATAMEDAMTVRQALEQKERKKDSATTLTPSQTAEQSGEASAVAPNPPSSSTASESADNTFNPNSDNSKRYEQGNGVILKREDGTSVRAQIVSEENEDGKIEVASSEGAIQGRDRVVYLTREELDQMYQGSFDIDTPDASSNEETQLSDTSIDSTPASPTPNSDSPIGRPMTEEEAVSFVDKMTAEAEEAPELELTAENWDKEFGDNGVVDTPIGKVHMGEHQFLKMMRQGRNSKLGMIKPTLTNPDIIIEDTSREASSSERSSSYIFAKSFKGTDGERIYYFTSITVSQDGNEVVISNQERRKNRILSLMNSGNILYQKSNSLHPKAQVGESVPLNESLSVTNADNNSDQLGIHSSAGASESKDSNNVANIKSEEEGSDHSTQEALSETPHSEERSEEHEWDELSKQVGDESAREIISSDISDLEAERKKLQKEISKPKGQTREEKIQYVIGRRERLQSIDAEIEGLQRVLQVPQMRIAQAEAQEREQNRIKAEEARRQEEADEQARAEKKRQEAERLEEERLRQEKLQGVPDWVDDTPQNARARGYRRSNGESYDRQERISNGVSGNEVQVKFSNEDMPTGRIMVIEADELQPSHIQGQRNPNFFIDEAQPKDRIDDASVLSARRIAGNMRPEEITGNATAYTGAPIVNSRGEVIQGNNRSDALRYMYQHEQEQAQKYKQYLLDNAERLGLSKDAIMQMNKPVLVTALEVSDNDAIRLGQMSASDTESGGVERIKPMQTITKMGDNIQSFSRILLSGDEDMDLSSVVDHNGADALKWMHSKGYITDTQYQSAFKAKGELTGEAQNDLINILSEVLFNGAGQQLRDDFEKLPAKAKKAILATIYRDLNSPDSERIIREVQDSIRAYAILQSNSKDFSKAKNTETALRAIDDWLSQQVFDDVSGEIYIPNDRLHFSNFALHLAGVYRGATQSYTSSVFNALYDDIQGLTSDMFDEESGKKHTLTEAIKRQLNIDYNGKTTSSDVAHASQNGSQRERGSSSDYKERNGTEGTSEPSRTGGRSQTDSREVESEKPTFLDVIRTLYEKGKEVASKLFGRSYFDVADTSNLLKKLGLTGDKFTIRYGVISRHFGKDAQHKLPLSVWSQLPKALNTPLIVTKYYTDKTKTKQKGYRIYTAIQLEDGAFVVAGVEVKNAGRNLEVNAIDTVFGRNNIIGTQEEIVYESKEMTPEQRTLLDGHNPHQYSATQESSNASDSKGSEKNTALTRSEKEELIAQAEQEVAELQSEASSLRRKAYQAMRDYYESGAVPDMTEEQFNGEAGYMFIGSENRNELALIHAPGLQDILPQLDELANKIRWYKLLIRNSKKALNAEQNTEGKVGNEDTRKSEDNSTEGIRFRRSQEELEEVNDRFNEQLEVLNEKTANSTILSLGSPSNVLLSAGVIDKPMRLYGNKVIKKMKKHGFSLSELRDLPRAVANPIAVFNNYGKDGSRSILTELQTEQGNFLVAIGLGNGTDVEFNIVRSAFGKGKEQVVDWFNSSYATYINKEKALEYLRTPTLIMGAISNQELSDATKVIESFENPNIEEKSSDLTDGIRFRGRKSNEEPKTLVGVHNLTEDKLHKAVRLGGLANPSIAVIDSSHQQHNGYGEISLVMPSSKINKTTGKNAGTFFGDAYTPRVPIIEKHLTDKGRDLLYQEFRSLPSEFKYKAIESVENWINEGRLSSGLYQAYLHSTGQGISLVYYQNREYPKDLADKALEIGNGATRYESLSTGQQYAISSLLLGQEGYPRSIEEYTQDYVESRKARLNELEEKIARGEKVLPRGKMILQRGLDYVNEVGYPDTFLDLGRGLYDSSILEGKLSVDQSNAEAKRIADEQADAFNKWLAGLAEHYQAEELLFDGLRSDGSKKYLPATLENISKAMKKQGLQGTEGDFGFHSFAASLINKAGTLNAIRKGKGQLANEEARKAFDEKWSKVFDKFVLKLKPQWASIGGDYVLNTALNAEPKAYAQKEYGIKLTDEDVTELKAMVDAIRNEMPVPYFETKFERPVGFNEFSSAIIPSNLSEEIKHSLKAQGLSIHEYEQGNEEDRQRAFNEAIQPETIRFRRGQELQEVNERFNEQLDNYIQGKLKKSEVIHLGNASGILASFVPRIPIILKQSILSKASYKKHDVDIIELLDMPKHISSPIFIFQKNQHSIGALTEMKDRQGRNIFVAIEFNTSLQSGRNVLEVNDIRSIHGRDIENVLDPILENKSLVYVDKTKALNWFSSASSNYQQEITNSKLSDATKVIKEFENPNIEENAFDDDILFRGRYVEGQLGYTERADGTPISNNAKYAEEAGKFPASLFKKKYGISPADFNMLNDLGLIEISEWHHTGATFRETDYYSWVDNAIFDDGYNSRQGYDFNGEYEYNEQGEATYVGEDENPSMPLSEWYKQNKKAIKPIADAYKVGEWTWEREDPSVGVHRIKNREDAERRMIETHFRKEERQYRNIHWGEYPQSLKDLFSTMLKWDENAHYEDIEAEAERLANEFYDAHIEETLETDRKKGEEGEAKNRAIREKNLSSESKETALMALAQLYGMDEQEAYNKISSSSWYNRGSLRRRSTSSDEASERNPLHAEMEREATSLAHSMGEEVVVVHNEEELVDILGEDGARQARGAKGFYLPKSGKVVIILSNNTDVADVLETIFHEFVGHKGLQEYVGKEEFTAFIDRVHKGLHAKALREIHDEAKQIFNERKGTSRAVSYQDAVREATEEYIARLSERGFSDRESRSTWQKIVDAFRDMISRAKLTLGWDIQDRDIRYILWKSFQMKQKQVAILAEAGDIAMRHRLGLPQKVKVTEGLRERRGGTSEDAEMGAIKAQAKKDGTFMKAPNGKPTKLTEKQWLQVRTQAFKNWFGDWLNTPENASKVVDENGEPMIVYHGSKNKFYSFDMELQKTAWMGKGFYFTPNKEFAKSFGRSVVSSFLNLRNPFIVKGNSPSYYDSEVGKIYGKDGGPIEPSEGTALLQDKGHDGVLFTHWDQGQMITVFTPSQIKSATENKGTFDKSNDDIRYRKIDNRMRSVPSEQDNKLAITTLSPSTEIPVVQTEKRSVSTAEAKQAIESLPKQVVTMDGYALNVSKKTKHKLGNSLSNSTREDYRQALTLLTQIVGNSVLIEEHRNRVKIDGERKADNPNDTNIENVQRFYGAITIGKVTYRVKTTAIVSANTEQGTRMHNYDITEIELLQPETPVSRSSSDQERSNSISEIELLPSSPTANSQELAHRSNSISLAKLLNGVGFSYEPERKILDEMQGGTEGIRFRQGNNSQTSWNESEAQTEYNRTTRITDENGNKSKSANLLWRLREAYQDSMLSLKALQDALAKNALGRDLRDFEDAYTAENAMGSKNLSEMEHYDARYVKPLTDAISELMKEGASYEDILNYLRAKHGLERNEYYNAQDRATAKDKWDSKEALKKQKNPNYQPKEFEGKGEFKDYSGLTGLTGSSEDFTKLAQDMVEEFENKFNTDALWTSVRNANQKTLELGRQKNLIGKHTYEHIKGMFEYYIPLRGWDSNRAEDEWEYLDGAGTMSGNSIRKSAKGRTSVSDDPIAMMIKLAEDTIRQGNRNMMKLKFLNLAENADDKLLQYSRAWFQKKTDQEGNEYWELVTPDIDDDASPEEVSEALLEFNQNMNNLKELGEATQYPPKDSRKNITFDKNGSLGERKQHTVTVYRGGQLYTIFVNGNPRAAQAINGSINAGQYSGQIENIVGPFNRWISAMHTSYNPEFIITNAVRDFQHATFMIFAQEGLGSKYMKDFQKQYVGGLKRSLGLYKRWRSGTLDLSRNEDKMFHDFMINGGQTGYTQISKIEDLKKKVEWELKKAKGEAGRLKVGFEILQEGLELFNGAIELNTRFATFVASRKSGRSIERSISDAKNIMVNFNKKGAGGYGAAFFQALYIFFNPAVQALEQSVRVSRKQPKRIAAMIGTMATLAYLQPILFELIGAAAGGDDDDEDAYDNINQNSRLSSLIIRNPLDTSTYINLPISPELKPFFTLGSALAEVQRGAMTPSEATGQILQGMTSLLPLDPAGGNGDKKWINIVPSVVQPLEQVAVNINYYGEPIYKDNGFNKLDPEWTKAKDANPIFTKTSEMLNEWSGGNKVRKGEIDINPEKVEHIVEGFTGGAGKATNALFKTFMMPFDSDMRKLNNTVMLRKFYKAIPQAKEGVLSRKIYELQERRKELLEHDKLGYKKQLRESKDTDDRMHWMDEMMKLVNSPEYKFFKKNKIKLDILFKLKDKYQKVTNDESRKTISNSMKEIQKEVLKDYENE